MRTRSRRIWLGVHFYIGTTLGLVFALLGLTGSVLVFYNGVDAWLNPAIRVSEPVAAKGNASPQAVLDKLRQFHPLRTGPWRIEMPLSADSPIMARYYRPVETEPRTFAPLMVTLDPKTLEQTAARFWGDYFVTWIYDLHYTLLLEKTGQTMVGIIGLIMLGSLITGLTLWWPSRARFVAAVKPVIRHGAARSNYDLHVLGGVYGWIVLVMLAVTGAALALPEWTKSAISLFTDYDDKSAPAMGAAMAQSPLSLDDAVLMARQHFPNAELRWIESSGAAGSAISIRFHQSFEPGRRFAQTQVWLDPHSGEVLRVWDPARNPAGNTLWDWMHPLHNGEVFGMAGRIIVCASGLIPALLFVTGFRRWRQKRRAALHKQSQRHCNPLTQVL